MYSKHFIAALYADIKCSDELTSLNRHNCTPKRQEYQFEPLTHITTTTYPNTQFAPSSILRIASVQKFALHHTYTTLQQLNHNPTTKSAFDAVVTLHRL